MLCIGSGNIDWNAVSAISTAAATIVALLASWLALKAPEWSRKAERIEATREVLRATREALEVHRGAVILAGEGAWPDDLVTLIRIRASHLHSTLDRLIGCPSLSDGAIAVGAGAMSVLSAILSIPTTSEARTAAAARSPNSQFARYISTVEPAKVVIESASDVVKVVEARIARVEAHLTRRWWHRWRKAVE